MIQSHDGSCIAQIELQICEFLCQVAEIPAADIDRRISFDAWGLDSLAKVGLVSELSRRLGLKIDPDEALEHTTPHALAEYVFSQMAKDVPHELRRPSAASHSLVERCVQRNQYFDDLRTKNRLFFEPVFTAIDGMWVECEGRRLLMMNSYNYLGLNDHPAIREAAHQAVDEFGPGIHGSRVLAGTTVRHRQLERTLAEMLHADDAVVFNTGYVTNVSTIQAIVGPGDVVLCDQLCHASIIDGARFSGTKLLTFEHNDPQSLAKLLKVTEADFKLVIVDGVYSMEGDIAPLPDIVAACRAHGACLMVDEAHSFPIVGPHGGGVHDHFQLPPDAIDIKMGTLSKGLSACGGYVAGKKALIGMLRLQARGFVFSGGLSAVQIAVAQRALEVFRDNPGIVQGLQKRSQEFAGSLMSAGFALAPTISPIIPILCRTEDQVWNMCRLTREQGLLVSPAVFPAVPKDKPRIRLSLTALHTADQLEFALTALVTSGKKSKLLP